MSATPSAADPRGREGSIWLPLTRPQTGLRIQAIKGTPNQAASLATKNLSSPMLQTWFLTSVERGAQAVRLVEPQQLKSIRWAELKVAFETESTQPMATTLESWAGCNQAELQAWAAAAGALADRWVQQHFTTEAAHILLLAGLSLEKEDMQRWGRLSALAPALEQSVLQALKQGPVPEEWKTALVILPRTGDVANRLGKTLSQLLPQAKICTADSLIGLSGPEGNHRRPRVGEVWFPIVGAQAASLHPLVVAVSPWKSVRGERPPIEVVVAPDATGTKHSRAQSQKLFEEIGSLLHCIREEEAPTARQWQTLVSVPSELLKAQGHSYQLALVIADRIARGREWPAAGRILATGGINTDRGQRARVLPVSGHLAAQPDANDQNHKLAAFLQAIRQGDTLLLPAKCGWEEEVSQLFRPNHRAADSKEAAPPHIVFVEHVIPC